MEWTRLLSCKRLGVTSEVSPSVGRSEFQRDFDRIAFSSAFRRLQDKTQVVPLPASDFVRTRLTHSLEVSSVGRSLGVEVGGHIFPKDYKKAADLGSIVAAACIAHDLGNPLSAIQERMLSSTGSRSAQAKNISKPCPKHSGWILKNMKEMRRDSESWQGYKIAVDLVACNLPMPHWQPLRSIRRSHLSQALMTFTQAKAPRSLDFSRRTKSYSNRLPKSWGSSREIRIPTGGRRHPLAFLVEAADDIAYLIMDFEDGYRLRRIDYAQISTLFKQI